MYNIVKTYKYLESFNQFDVLVPKLHIRSCFGPWYTRLDEVPLAKSFFVFCHKIIKGKRGGSPNWPHGHMFLQQKGSGVSKRLFDNYRMQTTTCIKSAINQSQRMTYHQVCSTLNENVGITDFPWQLLAILSDFWLMEITKQSDFGSLTDILPWSFLPPWGTIGCSVRQSVRIPWTKSAI